MKTLSILYILIFFLSLAGCSSSKLSDCAPSSGIAFEKLAIQPAANREAITKPLVHPVPAAHGDYTRKPMNRHEITVEGFLTQQVHQGQINSLVLTRDGLHAYSGAQDGKVIYSTIILPAQAEEQVDLPITGAQLKTETLLVGEKPVLAVSLSPDEKKLAVSQFSSIVVFDLESRSITNQLSRIKGRIMSLAWDPRGEQVLFGRPNGDVFVWNLTHGSQAGKDSIEALERYESGISPIVGLIFHPSGRAFFTAEREGRIFMWRLLRTERELGLRDESSVFDRAKKGRKRLDVARLHGEIESIWLNSLATRLFAATNTGQIFIYKVRGLRNEGAIVVGEDAVFSIHGIELHQTNKDFSSGSAAFRLLAASGREQRLSFWCEQVVSPAAESEKSEVIVVRTIEKDEEDAEQESDSAALESAENAESELPPGLVAQSALFQNPLTFLRNSLGSPLLWAAEKTGNLLVFNTDLLLESPLWVARAELCEE